MSDTLQIRTKLPVVNADSFNKTDVHITATLDRFDIITQLYDVSYYKNIETTLEGVTTTNLEHILGFSLRMTRDQVNSVLGYVNKDLNADGKYLDNIQSAMHDAFLIQVGADGRFGLTSADWEKAYNNIPESQINQIEITSPTTDMLEPLVEGTDIPFSIAITNPIELEKVEFYEGVNLIETLILQPDETNGFITWTLPVAGTYSITAKLYAFGNVYESVTETITIEAAV